MRRLLAVPAILLCLLFAPARAAEIQRYGVQGWQISVYTNDYGGGFSHCSAAMPYQNGIIMLLTINRQYHWSVAFYDPVWQLTVNGNYPITMTIDGGGIIPETAYAKTGQLAVIELPDSMPLFNAFRHGYQLRVTAAGQFFFFNLNGSNAALTALSQCVNSYGR
jgi:hypothetical protein